MRTKDKFLTTEDLDRVYNDVFNIQGMVDGLNKILSSEFAKATVVYDCGSTFAGTYRNVIPVSPGPNQYLLMFPEEIKRECVKHEPDGTTGKFYGAKNWVHLKCVHCGVEIEADWKAV